MDGWLPVKYFIKAVKINYSTCDIEELEFDRNIGMPNWAAELAPSGPGEAGASSKAYEFLDIPLKRRCI